MQQSVYHTCPRPPGNSHPKVHCVGVFTLHYNYITLHCNILHYITLSWYLYQRLEI